MSDRKPRLRFLYSGIRVRDLDRSLRFYAGLGFRERFRGRMDHGGIYVHLLQPGSPRRIELNFYPRGTRFYTAYPKGPEFDHFGFRTDNVDASVRWMKRLGGRVVVPAWTETGQRIAFVADPDGFLLEVFQSVPRVRLRRRRRHQAARRSRRR